MTTVGLDDLQGYCKSYAVTISFGGEVRTKDLIDQFGRDAWALVGDPDLPEAGQLGGAGEETDAGAGGGRLDAVGEDGNERVFDVDGVECDKCRSGLDVGFERDPLGKGHCLVGIEHEREEVLGIDSLKVNLERFGGAEQVSHPFFESVDCHEDAILIVFEIRAQGEFVACKFGDAPDPGEGITQIVSEATDHLADGGESFTINALLEHALDHGGHGVDLVAELGDFIFAANGDLMLEMALGDMDGRDPEVVDRANDPSADEHEGEHPDEDRGEGGVDQNPDEFSDNVVAEVDAAATVFEERALDSVDHSGGVTSGLQQNRLGIVVVDEEPGGGGAVEVTESGVEDAEGALTAACEVVIAPGQEAEVLSRLRGEKVEDLLGEFENRGLVGRFG